MNWNGHATITPDGKRSFTTHVDEHWVALKGVHGGIVAALTVDAVETVLRNEGFGAGTTLRAATFGYDGTVRLDPDTPNHFRNVETHLHPATTLFGGADRAEWIAWSRPLDADTFDTSWLTMFGDYLPPALFARTEHPTLAVTVEYSIQIHDDNRHWTLTPGEFLATRMHTFLTRTTGSQSRTDGSITLMAPSSPPSARPDSQADRPAISAVRGCCRHLTVRVAGGAPDESEPDDRWDLQEHATSS